MKTDRKVVISILAIAVFNFVFLGNEYMYDNMMMYVIDAGGVVTAQNYILGVSVAGFLLFPVISCLIGKMHSNSRYKYSYAGMSYISMLVMIIMLATGIACIWVMSGHKSYIQIFIAGSILFIIMGAMGSAVHYNFAVTMKGRSGLTIAAGIAYAGGIILQFINNNLIKMILHRHLFYVPDLYCYVYCMYYQAGIVVWTIQKVIIQEASRKFIILILHLQQ